MKVLGVDLGGTKIKIGVLDEIGNIEKIYLYPTKEPIYESLEKAIDEVVAIHSNIAAIGIGTPGFVDREKGKVIFSSENLPGWSGTEVKKKLESKFHIPVIVENDANVAALAEVKFGAAKGYDNALMLTLGTGVGGGVIVDGKILYGPNGAVGEFGHMILYPGGHLCNCGRRGCQEQYVSGRSLERRMREANVDMTPSALMQAKKHNQIAGAIIDDFTYDLALSISSLQAAFDMDILILGGGVSHSAEYWLGDLNKHLKNLLFHPLKVEVAKLKNDAGMIGAAQLMFMA
ncbi:sugar kinase [Virgibacillus indicus]|uniref:Sugar kinase n=1 Tax=Virgibacillus indicus TaxID=2024554 RepID=A0A265N571_9BACI|nr:ROK family protein [Virgibacillus indicus]OZU87178.1 sugar kinase [Virgibacillus indicus]